MTPDCFFIVSSQPSTTSRTSAVRPLKVFHLLDVHGASLPENILSASGASLTRLPPSRYGGLAAFAEATAPEETAAPCEVKSPRAGHNSTAVFLS
jgi:hypothetical protein